MKIECPHCNADNDIEFADNISCFECKKSFKGFKFSKRKLASVATVLLLGAGAFGGYKVNRVLEQERYPLKVEYAIVDTCVNASKNLMTTNWYMNKREICLCALSNTLQDIPYSDFQSKKAKFITRFNQYVTRCT